MLRHDVAAYAWSCSVRLVGSEHRSGSIITFKKEKKPARARGPFLVFLGACALSFGGLIVKSFDGSTLWQILFWRSLFFIGVITIFLIFVYCSFLLHHLGPQLTPGTHLDL